MLAGFKNYVHNFRMNEAVVTVIHAEQEWLEACAHVSQSTRSSYAGEARRFREYLWEVGVLDVQQITQQRWNAYLANLTQSRSAAITKRANALKPSSALQAARITRAFLRYCWAQHWLSWVPDVGSRRCPPVEPQAEFRAPDGLVDFLLNAGEADDESQSRLRCAVGLAFWGGFRPRELAELRARDLVPSADGCALLQPDWRADDVVLPAIMVRQLVHYATLRVERVGRLAADAPLIAQLNAAGPITAAAAWQLLKDWTVTHTSPDRARVSTRAIRESFKQLAGADADSYIRAIERQAAGRRRVGRGAASSAISAVQVTNDLVRKLAAAAAAA